MGLEAASAHALVSNAAWQRSRLETRSFGQQSLLSSAANAGVDMVAASAVVAAGAIGGASAGEIFGGDLVLSSPRAYRPATWSGLRP